MNHITSLQRTGYGAAPKLMYISLIWLLKRCGLFGAFLLYPALPCPALLPVSQSQSESESESSSSPDSFLCRGSRTERVFTCKTRIFRWKRKTGKGEEEAPGLSFLSFYFLFLTTVDIIQLLVLFPYALLTVLPFYLSTRLVVFPVMCDGILEDVRWLGLFSGGGMEMESWAFGRAVGRKFLDGMRWMETGRYI